MKLSKSILAAIVAGVTVTAVTTSCSKEEIRPVHEEEQMNGEIPTCGFGEESGRDDYDCPACGLG